MCRLWIDLRQFFTDEHHDLNPRSPESFIKHVVECFDEEKIEDFIENFSENELIDGDLACLEILDVHVFEDCFRMSLIKAVLMSFLDEEDFKIYGCDVPLESVYDFDKEVFLDITQCEFADVPHTMKKRIESFYREATKECYVNGKYDDYLSSTIYFRLSCVKFTNKSKARKLRKIINSHYEVEELFNQIGFMLEKGQLLKMSYAYIEADGFYFEQVYNFAEMNEGLDILRNEFNRYEYNDSYELTEVLISNMSKFNDLINDLLEDLETNSEVII